MKRHFRGGFITLLIVICCSFWHELLRVYDSEARRERPVPFSCSLLSCPRFRAQLPQLRETSPGGYTRQPLALNELGLELLGVRNVISQRTKERSCAPAPEKTKLIARNDSWCAARPKLGDNFHNLGLTGRPPISRN
jgi:hypothetical protein